MLVAVYENKQYETYNAPLSKKKEIEDYFLKNDIKWYTMCYSEGEKVDVGKQVMNMLRLLVMASVLLMCLAMWIPAVLFSMLYVAALSMAVYLRIKLQPSPESPQQAKLFSCSGFVSRSWRRM